MPPKPSPILSDYERRFLEAVSRLAYCNPFLPERIRLEAEALGDEFVETSVVWSRHVDHEAERANIKRLTSHVEPIADRLRDELRSGRRTTRRELELYQDLILYLLYNRYRLQFHEAIIETISDRKGSGSIRFYTKFAADFNSYLNIKDQTFPTDYEPAHVFACFFQIRRAFHLIFSHIIGQSMPAARLRAEVWQSIFTHDLKRYYRLLYSRMGDLATLITGPSGTGKELVARAIALARYIPFDESSGRFRTDFSGLFHPLNLSALSPTLIESELFGHKRGAFTGALTDRTGWLEVCSDFGTVFLDEIGDLDSAIQVKLLRVLQDRVFHALGDTKARHFPGKIIAATNRSLPALIAEGRFREDFYYRLCSDIIDTPSLQEQLAESPDELRHLTQFIAQRICGEEREAEVLTREVLDWVRNDLGESYEWPGNFRELEQCIRNLLVRRSYQPASVAATQPSDSIATSPADVNSLLMLAWNEGLSADELLARYCRLAYERSGSYEQAARKLGLDRRTVRRRAED